MVGVCMQQGETVESPVPTLQRWTEVEDRGVKHAAMGKDLRAFSWAVHGSIMAMRPSLGKAVSEHRCSVFKSSFCPQFHALTS